MSTTVQVFVGPRAGLQVICKASARASLHMLSPIDELLVMPLTQAVHDDLHGRAGTGQWLDADVLLTTTDMALAAAASKGCKLAYLEVRYRGGTGDQGAAAWADGELMLGPAAMSGVRARRVAPGLWPVNTALKAIGAPSTANGDVFAAIGLAAFHCSEDIVARAARVAPL